MNSVRLIIPVILFAVIFTAGIFAFFHIEKASTVHGTFLALIIEKDSGTGISDGDRIVYDCDRDFTVREIYFTVTNMTENGGGEEIIDIGQDDNIASDRPQVEIDGVPLTDKFGDFEEESFFGVEGNGGPNANATISWTGYAEDRDEEEFSYILFAEGEGTDDIVMYIFDDSSGNLNPLDGDEELTVKALFVTQASAVCTVDVDT